MLQFGVVGRRASIFPPNTESFLQRSTEETTQSHQSFLDDMSSSLNTTNSPRARSLVAVLSAELLPGVASRTTHRFPGFSEYLCAIVSRNDHGNLCRHAHAFRLHSLAPRGTRAGAVLDMHMAAAATSACQKPTRANSVAGRRETTQSGKGRERRAKRIHQAAACPFNGGPDDRLGAILVVGWRFDSRPT